MPSNLSTYIHGLCCEQRELIRSHSCLWFQKTATISLCQYCARFVPFGKKEIVVRSWKNTASDVHPDSYYLSHVFPQEKSVSSLVLFFHVPEMAVLEY